MKNTKIVALILATLLLLPLCACGKKACNSENTNAALSSELTAVLKDMHESYFPQTAGSSLTAARLAAQLADLFAKYNPKPEEIKSTVKAYYDTLDAEGKELFAQQINDIAGSFNTISDENALTVLEDAGYTPQSYPWSDEIGTLFESLAI
ncbi:MAG: hypothetical protein IJL87_00850 [Clostridia bacterium]|nr:hypothetical protein [Clostridia bacterium]